MEMAGQGFKKKHTYCSLRIYGNGSNYRFIAGPLTAVCVFFILNMDFCIWLFLIILRKRIHVCGTVCGVRE